MRVIVLAGVAVAAFVSPAAADGLDFELIGARAIGRAGAAYVSDDGAAALLLSPGAMVRRTTPRVQLGVGVHDSDARYRAPVGAGDDDDIVDRGAPTAAPAVAVLAGWGRLVVGLGAFETADVNHALPQPEPGQPLDDIARLFPHRYGGTALSYQRRAVAAGVAVRATPWLGVGVTFTAAQAELVEERHVWAGFNGIDAVGDPSRDLALTLSGRDRFVAGAVAGALIAPPPWPVEFAVSVAVQAGAGLSGDADLASTQDTPFPEPIVAADARARMTLPSPIAIRGGVRYLGERVFAELGGEYMAFVGDSAPSWTIEGVSVGDDSGRVDALTAAPSLVARRDHGAVRASVDVAVVGGFLYLSAGYGLHTSVTAPERLAPGYARLTHHTVGFGAEGQWNGVAMAVGYARSLSAQVSVADSAVTLINPFDAGTASAADGDYDRGHDAFGVSIEMTWE